MKGNASRKGVDDLGLKVSFGRSLKGLTILDIVTYTCSSGNLEILTATNIICFVVNVV